jgi:serine/threonine-protein kinase
LIGRAVAFDLEALGGLRLIAADGQVVQAQRRRLALLALLAAAGERGLTRDQLVGCLWPEASEENAKHALNQLLYGIRRSLGEDALHGVDLLRLDPAVIDSDVRRFEHALSSGAYGDAVTHYRGPFLEGFYLADAPAFERRVESERARLAAAYADALERLAADAESGGDACAAVVWRRRLAELDPLDARRATGLMRALAAAGDSGGALAHGRTYEALVRGELDAPADPAVIGVASEIRAASERQPTTETAPAPTIGTAAPVAPPNAGIPYWPPPAGREAPAPNVNVNAAPAAARADSRPARRRLLVSAAVGGVALLIVTLATLRPLLGRRADAPPPADSSLVALLPSIAVLPLKIHSTDPRDAALTDGLTEELIATLSSVGNLRVIPTASVSALQQRGLDMHQIAESLRVSHVLEGGVQKVGPRMRMRFWLVDARDGSTGWTETYDREIGDIFAAQEDIARAVARELDVRLAAGARRGSTPRRYTPNIAAYEWYLRGMDVALLRSDSGRRQGLEYFNRAIAADSNYAAAYAGLVRMYVTEAGRTRGDHREWFARAEDAALKAVALDDSLAEAHAALGWARMVNRDYAAAEAELKRAIALDPAVPRGYEGLARVHMMTGRPAEQLAVARRALDVDPFSTSAVREMALALSMNGRCDEAIELLRPHKTLNPPAGVAAVIMGQCYAKKHMWPAAIAEFRWAIDKTDARAALAFLGYALARAGQRDEAMIILSDLRAGRKNSHDAFGIAVVYTGLRDYDQAFTWLEKAADENSVRGYIMDPLFDDLHRDPRFDRWKKRIGL